MALDPAVHHVGGSDDVAPGLGLDQRLLDQNLDRLVVCDGVATQEAIMAMAGIGIERDIAEDTELRHRLLDGANCAAHQIFRIECFAAVLVAQDRIGIGKQSEARDRELGRPLGIAHGLVDREAVPPQASTQPACVSSIRPPETAAKSGHPQSARFPERAGASTRPCGCGADGSEDRDASSGATGTNGASIGRPYLIAMVTLRADSISF